MSEGLENFTSIWVGECEVPVNRENLFLVRHLGADAMYDHCYVVQPNGRLAFIWDHNPRFARLAQLAEEHRAQRTLDKTKVDSADIERFITHESLELSFETLDEIRWKDSTER